MTNNKVIIGDCEVCHATNVKVLLDRTARGNIQMCETCHVNQSSVEALENMCDTLEAFDESSNPSEPAADVTEIPDDANSTLSLADRQDLAIFNASVVYYGQIYSGLSPNEQIARLTADDRHIQLLVKDAARHLQVLKIRQQAIRKRRADTSANQTLAELEQMRKADSAFDNNMQAFQSLTSEPFARKKSNPLANKLDKLGLKTAILSGSLDDALAKVKAKKESESTQTEPGIENRESDEKTESK